MKNFFIKLMGINDICLTAFLSVLIINMFLNMLFPVSASAEKTVIDVATRTATAVLAGYFISKGFSDKKDLPLARGKRTRKNIQSFIVAMLGFASLSILLIVRYADGINFSAATVSQIRDLFLASVAFLMGTPD